MLDRVQQAMLAVAEVLQQGSVITVDRPNAFFGSALKHWGWNKADVLSCIPESFINSQTDEFFYPMPASWSIISGTCGRLFLSNNRQMFIVSLDRRFGYLKRCSALQIGPCSELPGILAGGAALIASCKPTLMLTVAESQLDAVRSWLDARDYSIYFDQLCDDGFDLLRGREPQRFLVATVEQTAQAAIHASFQVNLLRFSGEQVLSGWADHLSARDLAAMNGVTVDVEEGREIFWTGPSRATTFRIWLPKAGRFEFQVDLLGSSKVYGGDVTLRIGDVHEAHAYHKMDGLLSITLNAAVSEKEAENGVLVALVGQKTSWRTLEGKDRRIGLAVASLSVRYLEAADAAPPLKNRGRRLPRPA